ncbi:flagellar biosynthetic protein FliP [Lachnospiraceae bacterium]|nr:flagellar type III secretion system pore protein FliP [uncultured Schaedlerella sp.]EOS34456.1 flagellar biosynthetic protein FliP [Lachnospiraceae bacterium M18-1]NBI57769.1 flagellar biosynthetic protein FliP [Lachnospiraceae bacterium]
MYDALINVNGEQVPTLDILLMLTIISLLPSLLIMVTSFTRTMIILSFLRTAMGVQQTPPNMVLVGIALFLTLFIMNPVISDINTQAYTPYKNNEITQEEAISRAQVPLKRFMLRNTEKSSLILFTDIAGQEVPDEAEYEDDNAYVEALIDLPMSVVIPSFMTSELKRGFTAGFLLYIPFLLIDIVVSSTLMSMGMMMLPPAMISMPFKLLLFITVNGWELLFSNIVSGFK